MTNWKTLILTMCAFAALAGGVLDICSLPSL